MEAPEADGSPAAATTPSAAAIGGEGLCGEAAGLAVGLDACWAAASVTAGSVTAVCGAAAVSTGGSRSVL